VGASPAVVLFKKNIELMFFNRLATTVSFVVLNGFRKHAAVR
jgi:hypothetical protein